MAVVIVGRHTFALRGFLVGFPFGLRADPYRAVREGVSGLFGRVVVLCDFLGLVDFAGDLVACFVAGGPAGAHGPAFDLALAGVAFYYFDPIVFSASAEASKATTTSMSLPGRRRG